MDQSPSATGMQIAVERIVAIGRALSDPIRVRMLSLLALGRDCCDLPCCSLPAMTETAEGICVCELVAYFGLGQSKVSYHLRVLKEAGLVTETVRGKWSFYLLNRKTVRQTLGMLNFLAAAPISSTHCGAQPVSEWTEWSGQSGTEENP